MSEFSKLYDDEFFIIDSKNLELVNPKLYGFSILNSAIVKNEDIDNDVNLLGLGSYIHIKEDDDKIFIYQDFNGSWGLYLYQTEDYFAISNSFLKLVEYLKGNYKISFNEDYAKSLISTNGSTLIFSQTLVNEISVVPRNQFIIIDKCKKHILFEKIDYKSHSVSLNSTEALSILDNWFYRWIHIIRSIKINTNNIKFDLTGSVESKIILIFALFANINLDQIYFETDDSNLSFIEKIAGKFDFKLNYNNFSAKKRSYEDISTIINMAGYIKLGFHNQLDYKFFRTDEPIYHFSGSPVEMIGANKLYENKSFNQIFNHYITCASDIDKSFMLPFKKELNLSFKNLMKEFEFSLENSNDLFYLNYDEVISANHFGKFSVAEFLTNEFFISPFMDPELHKLKLTIEECNDKYLLYVVIFIRYFPSLFKFIKEDLDISYKTVYYALKINIIKPLIFKDLDYVKGPDLIEDKEDNDIKFSLHDIIYCFKKAFKSHAFKQDFEKFFSENFYWNLVHLIENNEENYLEKISSVFQVLHIIDNMESNSYLKFDEWLFNLIERDRFHGISAIFKLDDKLNSKAHSYHVHEFLSKNQIDNLQKMIKNNRIYKMIDFDIENRFMNENIPIILFNLKILDFEDRLIEINFDELYVIYDDNLIIPFKNISIINSNNLNEYYQVPTQDLKSGEHRLCLRYKDTYSEDVAFYIKDEKNLFNINEWLSLNIDNFDKFNVESISCSFDWADIGEKSVKVVCDGKNEYQALVTSKQNVDIDDIISAYVTIFNPEEAVTVRLFEHSAESFTDIIVPPSKIPKRVNILRKTLTNNVQLLLISRVKQTFYADNFVFTIN